MQVSHTTDHITHAVIGGKETIDFGISQSAEFFQILSSTLYKDQILAVVRETLCNAWDAHIEAKCTDKAVEVTLVDGKLTVKDFGLGIHHDDMGIIYGTYGNSTKKNDGTQTGGFGLGCKSPFAYVDHFEVTSAHAGTKTIYALAKSSAQVMGKPGITPIAQFPTEETGLTVSVDVQGNDRARFIQLIKRIAFNGDMNVKFNDVPLETLNFDVSKNNWMVLGDRVRISEDSASVYVRYGNVIYPIQTKELPTGTFDNLLNTLRSQHRYINEGSAFIFQAPPHSIAVTPSRESLSMQPHTVRTLEKLFTDFESQYQKLVPSQMEAIIAGAIDKLVQEKNYYSLITDTERVPGIQDQLIEKGRLESYYEVANQLVAVKTFNSTQERIDSCVARVGRLLKENYADRGLLQTYLREMTSKELTTATSHRYRQLKHSNWFAKRISYPLMQKLIKAGLSTGNMYMMDNENEFYTRYRSHLATPLVTIQNSSVHPISGMQYLKPLVVLATNRSELRTRVHEYVESGIPYKGFLVFLASRKKGDYEAARDFFQAMQGIHFLDLVEEEKANAPTIAVEVTTVTAKRKPVKKGLVALTALYEPKIDQYKHSKGFNDDVARIIDPKYTMRLNKDDRGIGYLSRNLSDKFMELFGSEGGGTTNGRQASKWGALLPSWEKYLADKLMAFVPGNTNIAQYYALNQNIVRDVIDEFSDPHQWVEVLLKLPQVVKMLGYQDQRTDLEKTYCAFLEDIHKYSYPALDKLYRELTTQPLPPKAQAALTKIRDSGINTYFDVYRIDRLLQNKNTAKKATQMLLFILQPK